VEVARKNLNRATGEKNKNAANAVHVKRTADHAALIKDQVNANNAADEKRKTGGSVAEGAASGKKKEVCFKHVYRLNYSYLLGFLLILFYFSIDGRNPKS